jgi:hypothetical protein
VVPGDVCDHVSKHAEGCHDDRLVGGVPGPD